MQNIVIFLLVMFLLTLLGLFIYCIISWSFGFLAGFGRDKKCLTTSDCGVGFYCDESRGYCAVLENGKCKIDKDCAIGYVCESNICIPVVATKNIKKDEIARIIAKNQGNNQSKSRLLDKQQIPEEIKTVEKKVRLFKREKASPIQDYEEIKPSEKQQEIIEPDSIEKIRKLYDFDSRPTTPTTPLPDEKSKLYKNGYEKPILNENIIDFIEYNTKYVFIVTEDEKLLYNVDSGNTINVKTNMSISKLVKTNDRIIAITDDGKIMYHMIGEFENVPTFLKFEPYNITLDGKIIHISTTVDGNYIWAQTAKQGILIPADMKNYTEEPMPKNTKRFYGNNKSDVAMLHEDGTLVLAEKEKSNIRNVCYLNGEWKLFSFDDKKEIQDVKNVCGLELLRKTL